MARWVRPVISIITVVTLAATPAVLAACVALCVGQQAAGSSTSGGVPGAHASHCSAAAAGVRVSGTSHTCCGDDLSAPVASVSAGRADTHLLDATAVASRTSWVHTVVPAPVPPRQAHARPPSSPPRDPAVLRI